MADLSTLFVQDPDAVLDRRFDWAARTNGTGRSDWLAEGETITDHTVTVSAGITLDSSSITDDGTSVTAWLSAATAGAIHTCACRITTSAGRTDERTISIQGKQR